MSLDAQVDRYALRHDCAAATVAQLRIVARLFSAWAGGADVTELTDDLVNSWLVARRDAGRAPRTVRGNRTSLLMLWRDAYENGEAATAPRRVRLVKCPELIVDGYDAGQMGRLIRSARELRGCFSGSRMPRAVWWRSLLLAYWDTGLRLGDLFEIERGWIWPQPGGGGALVTVQSKTGRQVRHILRPETMAAIDESLRHGGERRPIWAGFIGRRHFYPAFKKLAAAAGLAGTSKWIRRGSSSEVEKMQPGAGARHLGHKTAGMFEKHYRIDRIIQADVPLPPPIA